jgi:serine/threonine-protein kinase
MLVVVGLLVLIGTQAMPWLSPRQAQKGEPEASKAAAAPSTSPSTNPAEAATTSPATSPVAPPGPDAKPSPMAPPESAKPAAPKLPEEDAAKTVPQRRPARAAAAVPQPVTVISSPGGATAILDGRSETACTTPCDLDATPGHHTVTVSLPGYGTESREVDAGPGPMEMPAIVMRAQGGTLMLTSVPPGASISIDGKRISQATPAQIALKPGSHNIEVEKDGKQTARSVEIRNGVISYLKITF